MKNYLIFICIAGIIFLFLFCEKNETDENSALKYVATVLGGCNGQDSRAIKSTDQEKDTVVFIIKNDTLHVNAGINYICCAPFGTAASVKHDTLSMTITDICPDLKCSYCKCMCYYTFDFLFTGFTQKKYYYRIILDDPRQSGPAVIREGWIDLAQL